MKKRHLIFGLVLVLLLSAISTISRAQNPTDPVPKDPGSLSVNVVQNLSFGAFTQSGNGGTLTVAANGTRSVTGSVVPLNLGPQFFPAEFEVEAPVGSIISILNGPDVILRGSNGGAMSLHLSNSTPASPFNITVPPPGRTLFSFGGTLTIGSPQVTLPGNYIGTFSITFNQE